MKIRHEVIFPNELFSGRDSGRSQSLTINQYLLFSWVICKCIAVNLAVHCNGLGFLVGDLGVFGERWQMWDR